MVAAAWRRYTAIAIAPLPALLAWPPLRDHIEARMSSNMLGEWPLLLLAGAAAHELLREGNSLARRVSAGLARIDARGGLGLTVAACVAMFWMIPSAVDASLMSRGMSAAKYFGWWLSGFLLAGGLCRASAGFLLYVVGGLAMMTATVGLIYVDSTQRLCVNYLMDDQQITGYGLVIVAAAAGFWAVFKMVCLSSEPHST